MEDVKKDKAILGDDGYQTWHRKKENVYEAVTRCLKQSI